MRNKSSPKVLKANNVFNISPWTAKKILTICPPNTLLFFAFSDFVSDQWGFRTNETNMAYGYKASNNDIKFEHIFDPTTGFNIDTLDKDYVLPPFYANNFGQYHLKMADFLPNGSQATVIAQENQEAFFEEFHKFLKTELTSNITLFNNLAKDIQNKIMKIIEKDQYIFYVSTAIAERYASSENNITPFFFDDSRTHVKIVSLYQGNCFWLSYGTATEDETINIMISYERTMTYAKLVKSEKSGIELFSLKTDLSVENNVKISIDIKEKSIPELIKEIEKKCKKYKLSSVLPNIGFGEEVFAKMPYAISPAHNKHIFFAGRKPGSHHPHDNIGKILSSISLNKQQSTFLFYYSRTKPDHITLAMVIGGEIYKRLFMQCAIFNIDETINGIPLKINAISFEEFLSGIRQFCRENNFIFYDKALHKELNAPLTTKEMNYIEKICKSIFILTIRETNANSKYPIFKEEKEGIFKSIKTPKSPVEPAEEKALNSILEPFKENLKEIGKLYPNATASVKAYLNNDINITIKVNTYNVLQYDIAINSKDNYFIRSVIKFHSSFFEAALILEQCLRKTTIPKELHVPLSEKIGVPKHLFFSISQSVQAAFAKTKSMSNSVTTTVSRLTL